MFGVFVTGGKQFCCIKGSVLKLEKLDASHGEQIKFDQVLMIKNDDGSVSYNSGTVVAEVLEQKRDKKVLIFKKKRRKGYTKKIGHRQYLTMVKVIDIIN